MAKTPTNLNEYYTQQGQTLPTVQARQDVASKAGITGYTGTAEQNGTLLGYLQGMPANKGTGTPAPITASGLQDNPTPVVIPAKPIDTSSTDMNNSISGLLASTKKNIATDVANQDAKTAELEKLITSQGDQGAVQEKILADNGVDSRKKIVDSLSNSIETEQKSLQDKIASIRTNPTGMSAQAVEAEVARATTESSQRLSNYGIALSSANRDYTTASNIAQRQIDANTAKLKASIEAKTFVLQQLGTKTATEMAQAFQLQVKQLDNEADLTKQAIDSVQKAVTAGTIDGDVGFKAVSDLVSGKIGLVGLNNLTGGSNTVGIIDGIDITKWATDPKYYDKVSAIYKGLEGVTDAKSIDAYIQGKLPSSPLKGEDIVTSANKYGISPQLMLAMVQQESILGTSNVSKSNNNFGGLTWSDTYGANNADLGAKKGSARPASEGGNYTKFPTPQDGLDAMARLLSKNKAKAVYQGQYASTIDTAKSFEPADTQGKYKQELQKLIANGDYTTAYQRMQNTVAKSLTGENKTQFVSKVSAIPAIDDLTAKLKAFEEMGGKTGLLKGTYEDIIGKLGKVSDPKYKALATDLKISLQAYRQNLSGSAFSTQEASDYASVNPSGTNKLDLNLSILEGMRANFSRTVNSMVDSQLGVGAKNIRDSIPYQGLKPSEAIVKYGTLNPDKQQMIKELKLAGATDAVISLKLGLPVITN